MTNFSTMPLLGVLLSIAFHMVFADDTMHEALVGGWSRPTTSLGIDEVELLQTEVVTQSSSSKVEAGSNVLDEDSEAKGSRICQDLSGNTFTNDMSCPPLEHETILEPIQNFETVPRTELGNDVPEEQAPPNEEDVKANLSFPCTSTSILNWCLDILVFVVIVDGIRRWRNNNLPGPKKTLTVDSWQTMMQAAISGDTARFEALVRGSVDVTRADSWGCTLVHGAAKGGSTQILSQVLKHGGKVNDMDIWDETPLHTAARAGHTDVCQLLLAHGALINVNNADNWTPLLVAAHDGHKATCKMLLDHGANADSLLSSEVSPVFSALLKEVKPVDGEDH